MTEEKVDRVLLQSRARIVGLSPVALPFLFLPCCRRLLSTAYSTLGLDQNVDLLPGYLLIATRNTLSKLLLVRIISTQLRDGTPSSKIIITCLGRHKSFVLCFLSLSSHNRKRPIRCYGEEKDFFFFNQIHNYVFLFFLKIYQNTY